jgi:hypothetical protein
MISIWQERLKYKNLIGIESFYNPRLKVEGKGARLW